VAWLSGSGLVSINVVTLRRARLVLRWVTVYERVSTEIVTGPLFEVAQLDTEINFDVDSVNLTVSE